MDLLTFLESATPDEWHQVAWSWNWDYGVKPLQWIIRQLNCDRGTALRVYWGAGPRYLAQYAISAEVPEYSQNEFDLVMDIEQRYLAGAYTRQEIAFDPHNDEGQDWTAEYSDISYRRPIPDLMYIPTLGRPAERRRKYVEGYPPGVDMDDDTCGIGN